MRGAKRRGNLQSVILIENMRSPRYARDDRSKYGDRRSSTSLGRETGENKATVFMGVFPLFPLFPLFFDSAALQMSGLHSGVYGGFYTIYTIYAVF